MVRLARAALGIAGCALLTGCFKLNPEFASRVEEGQQVLFVFDEQTCQLGRVEPVVGDVDLVLPSECASCIDQGLRIDCDPMMAAAVRSRVPLDLGSGDAFTLEVWVSMDAQDNVGRMLGLSNGDGNDFQLDVPGEHSVQFRYALSEDSPRISGIGGGDEPGPWHLAVTHDDLATRLFVDDMQVAERPDLALPSLGTRSLTIGGTNMPWTGTVHLLAIYDRALDIDEYLINHEAGPTGQGGS